MRDSWEGKAMTQPSESDQRRAKEILNLMARDSTVNRVDLIANALAEARQDAENKRLREALVKALIPLKALEMSESDGDALCASVKQGIKEGLSAGISALSVHDAEKERGA